MNFEFFGEEYKRTFTSIGKMYSKIYGKQQLEKHCIVSGGHETHMIDMQFVIDT